MFRPFSIREIYRYIIPGLLMFYLMIYPFTDVLFPWWGFFNVTEKIVISLIISVIIGILLEPIMTSLGLFVLKHPNLIPKRLAKIDTNTLKEVVSNLFKGIFIVANESEKELLWHTTATYYLYASCSLILFFNAMIYLWKFVSDYILLGVFPFPYLCFVVCSVILWYTCLKQLIIYLEMNTSYLKIISKKYEKDIKINSEE